MTLVGAALAGCGDSDGVAREGAPATEAALTEVEAAGSRVVAKGIAGDDDLGATAVGPEAPEVTFLDAVPASVHERIRGQEVSSRFRKREAGTGGAGHRLGTTKARRAPAPVSAAPQCPLARP